MSAGDLMVWVGAIVAIVGLLMIVVVFILETIANARGAGPTSMLTGWAEAAKALLEFFEKFVAKPFRTGFALVVLGGVIMGAGLYLQNREEDDDDTPGGTTTTQTTTG